MSAADYVLRGGLVIDGTGSPPSRADIAIAGERVSAISSDRTDLGIGATTKEIDVSGQFVAPGFIDIHTHYDAQVFWDPALTPSCYHGVTSVIAGNCGFSIAPVRPEHHELVTRTLEGVEDMSAATLRAGVPWDFETFPEYLASVKHHGAGLNFGAYLGHTALRLYSMGDDAYERVATDQEVSDMQQILAESLRAGACGFATSFAVTHRGVDGKPIPSRHADRAEFEALVAAACDPHWCGGCGTGRSRGHQRPLRHSAHSQYSIHLYGVVDIPHRQVARSCGTKSGAVERGC